MKMNFNRIQWKTVFHKNFSQIKKSLKIREILENNIVFGISINFYLGYSEIVFMYLVRFNHI